MNIDNLPRVRELANELKTLETQKAMLDKKDDNIKTDYDLKHFILSNIDLIDDAPQTIGALSVLRNVIKSSINNKIDDIKDEIETL